MNEGSVDFNSVRYINLHDTAACVTQQPKVNLVNAMAQEQDRKMGIEPHKKKREHKTKSACKV